MQRSRMNTLQLWNMSFGFFGIQFGWGLQMANMSAIYEYLGAGADEIPFLWLAAPLTGFLIQPLIGYMSDRTWTRLGRRRPYFTAGAILSSAALVLMPNSKSLWFAAVLLWVLDASINISMEPFRALVADLLPDEQRTQGFAMQSVCIGLGAVLASALPFVLRSQMNVTEEIASHAIPSTIKLSFYVGAIVFLASVMWTVFTTKEHAPENQDPIKPQETPSLAHRARELLRIFAHMPLVMRQLAWVQICTWMGLFCMWIYFGPAIARAVFGAQSETSPEYSQGIEWGGVCFAVYSAVCFVFAFALPTLARTLGRRGTHALCLVFGGVALLSLKFIHSPWMLFLPMTGVGIAWSSILSMPYAMLTPTLPSDKIGVYMGIFNLFIVLPEIAASLLLGSIMKHCLHNDRLAAVILGGCFLLLAAVLVRGVDPREAEVQTNGAVS